MSKRIFLGLLSSLLLTAACAHERVADNGLEPNVGGDYVDQSSSRSNTDAAVAEWKKTPQPASATGTGSSQDQ